MPIFCHVFKNFIEKILFSSGTQTAASSNDLTKCQGTIEPQQKIKPEMKKTKNNSRSIRKDLLILIIIGGNNEIYLANLQYIQIHENTIYTKI